MEPRQRTVMVPRRECASGASRWMCSLGLQPYDRVFIVPSNPVSKDDLIGVSTPTKRPFKPRAIEMKVPSETQSNKYETTEKNHTNNYSNKRPCAQGQTSPSLYRCTSSAALLSIPAKRLPLFAQIWFPISPPNMVATQVFGAVGRGAARVDAGRERGRRRGRVVGRAGNERAAGHVKPSAGPCIVHALRDARAV
jgi:hypothetical protein